ncbi:MAG TPA: hypothetical protein VGP22_10215 [Albitalea sp.]|nr:hypothetical protein [Albitalea sp.]
MTPRFNPSHVALAAAMLMSGGAFAAPGANSPYRTDLQNTHVEDATSRGVNQVNMITCFISAMRPDALVNQGPYIALVDEKKCDPEQRSSSGNSGSTSAGANAPAYMKAILDSTREADQPMRARTWVEEAKDGFDATIFINISATEAPSASNPYGVFRMDYCGKGASGPCMMRGLLQGSATGISYFESEAGGGGGGGGTKALTLTTSSADTGAGMLQMSEMGQSVAFSFAYNANYFLRHADGSPDQCFSRDANDTDAGMSVWRYGLYDAGSGERVNLSSGFPIEYAAPDTKTYNGHMGYWGLWLPPEASSQIASGATVQRVEYVPNSAPQKTPYTLVKADGRLMKYTKQTRKLAAADKIRFQTWIWNLGGFFEGAVANRQYEMYWDDTNGVFKATGIVECGNNGCETQTFDVEKSVTVAYFRSMGGMRGWSQALGGEMFIPLAASGDTVVSADVDVIYRVQDLVYPANMPASLYCLRDCPTAATMASFFAEGSSDPSPYVPSTFNNWQPNGADGVVAYTTDAAQALLRDATNAAVTFINRDALQGRPQFQNGVRTGKLFTALAGVQCSGDASHYCDNRVDELDTYYQWETGPNQWNQFAAVKDSGGNVVAFDAPLQVSYAVPASGAQYGPYAGKSIVLQYGGFGELWGIPGHCVSRLTNDKVSCETQDSRYVPAFVVPFDEVIGRVSNGSSQMLAKWLDREIRFARKDPAVCATAGVTLPSGLTLPTAALLQDPSDSTSAIYIGAKPVVTAAPRVIHGDVKY